MNRLKRKAQDTNDITVVTPKDIQLLSDLKALMEEQNKLLKSKLSDWSDLLQIGIQNLTTL